MGDANDSVLLMTVVVIFLILGFVLPYVNTAFGQPTTDINTEGLITDTGNELSTSEVSIFTVFTSIITVFFWTFGQVPVWVDILIFTPMRVLLALLIYRNIRGV